MRKKELEEKVEEYKEILIDIGKWAFPQQYVIDNYGRAFRHLEGIRSVLKKKFYKEAE